MYNLFTSLILNQTLKYKAMKKKLLSKNNIKKQKHPSLLGHQVMTTSRNKEI